jgi:hypothetical protein
VRASARAKTERAKQNLIRAMRAVTLLHNEPPSWFLDWARGIFKQGVLEALGRLEDPRKILAGAQALVTIGPTSTRKVQGIFRKRRNAGRRGDLSGAIQSAIRDYRDRHIGTKREEIHQALVRVLRSWSMR